jgi:hypothetical protein
VLFQLAIDINTALEMFIVMANITVIMCGVNVSERWELLGLKNCVDTSLYRVV